VAVGALVAGTLVGVLPGTPVASATGLTVSASPASLVDPFVGTGSGNAVVGDIDTFPGASLPFGMLQWGPDTSPNRTDGGGYDYNDSQITGLSLTHLSGPGCPVAEDVPFLPVAGSLPTTGTGLQGLTEPFSHSNESASPGSYQVALGNPAVNFQVSATARAGIGVLTYPAGSPANLLIKAGDSDVANLGSWVATAGTNLVVGSAISGGFCAQKNTYTVYFAAEFSAPFTSQGTWNGATASPGATSAVGAQTGAWLGFGTPATATTVTVKVGISYVSAANALTNLATEIPGWSLTSVQSAATQAWNAQLQTVQVAGGTTAQQQAFYTALYHASLDPTLSSDDNGQYLGFDRQVHTLAAGQTQYSSISGWDVYRSEIPLITLMDPAVAGQVAASLVRDEQQGGWLPKWPVASGYTGVMNGDSADPILAEVAAFGGTGFDEQAALTAMIKGATQVPTTVQLGQGWYAERPDLASYLQLGYVPNTDMSSGSLTNNGASETLEYAEDDFTIAALAKSLGDSTDAATFVARAQNWQNQLNPATGYLQPRDATGAYPSGNPLTAGDGTWGQSGYQEGDTAQYNWLVPQNYAALITALGGDAAVVSRLDTFFGQTNAGPLAPYFWAGNEVDLEAPYVFDYAGVPWQTQAVVRHLLDSQYALTPAGEPGNDDLGELSSWQVWGMLGLYPVTPGTGELSLASPLFPVEVLHLPGGHSLTLVAPAAADNAPYIQALAVNGQVTQSTWISIPQLLAASGNATMAFALSSQPDPAWGAANSDAPPSYPTVASLG
jgi:predicted alpha-1,2-mannosidase